MKTLRIVALILMIAIMDVCLYMAGANEALDRHDNAFVLCLLGGVFAVMAFHLILYAIRDAYERNLADRPNPFQQRVRHWVVDCFGENVANDTIERNHRFLEEALELVQACECTREEAHKLVDYVYGRPVGNKGQEVGGVMVTLAALCSAQEIDLMLEGNGELARINRPLVKDRIREKQRRKPAMSPLPGVYPESEAFHGGEA